MSSLRITTARRDDPSLGEAPAHAHAYEQRAHALRAEKTEALDQAIAGATLEVRERRAAVDALRGAVDVSARLSACLLSKNERQEFDDLWAHPRFAGSMLRELAVHQPTDRAQKEAVRSHLQGRPPRNGGLRPPVEARPVGVDRAATGCEGDRRDTLTVLPTRMHVGHAQRHDASVSEGLVRMHPGRRATKP